MLIKSEVDRRIDTLSKYIFQMKDKVYASEYEQAKELLRREKKSINDNYISPYNPNTYIIDSLSSKNEKLNSKISAMKDILTSKRQQYEEKLMTKGYQENTSFIKLQNYAVGIYLSRIPITLDDTLKLEFEKSSIKTDPTVVIVPASLLSTPIENQVSHRNPENCACNALVLGISPADVAA